MSAGFGRSCREGIEEVYLNNTYQVPPTPALFSKITKSLQLFFLSKSIATQIPEIPPPIITTVASPCRRRCWSSPVIVYPSRWSLVSVKKRVEFQGEVVVPDISTKKKYPVDVLNTKRRRRRTSVEEQQQQEKKRGVSLSTLQLPSGSTFYSP